MWYEARGRTQPGEDHADVTRDHFTLTVEFVDRLYLTPTCRPATRGRRAGLLTARRPGYCLPSSNEAPCYPFAGGPAIRPHTHEGGVFGTRMLPGGRREAATKSVELPGLGPRWPTSSSRAPNTKAYALDPRIGTATYEFPTLGGSTPRLCRPRVLPFPSSRTDVGGRVQR